MAQFFASILFKVWLEVVDNVYTLSYYFRTGKFDWSEEKNMILEETRGIRFEDIALALDGTGFAEVVAHYNRTKYPNQYLLKIEMSGFIYLVPFVIGEKALFFKTIYPSRKYTDLWKKYEKKL